MLIESQRNVGDCVWAVACHTYDKDVECPACRGECGATIPGTGVRVQCQECLGVGTTTGLWYSFDVWRAEITRITARVEVRFVGEPPLVTIEYSLTGIWDDGQRCGCQFTANESEVFGDKASAVKLATTKAAGKDDARIGGVKQEATT